MHSTPPTTVFTERTDLRHLHFAMIATRSPGDEDTIRVEYLPSLSEQDHGKLAA